MSRSLKQIYAKVYFPGLISLAFFPILCVCYIHYCKPFKKEFGITVSWLSQTGIEQENRMYPNYKFVLPQRKYTEIVFNESDNSKALIALEGDIKRMNSQKDTMHAYRVKFTANTFYNDIVKVIDLCNQVKDDQFGWVLIDNRLVMVYIPPHPPRPSTLLPCALITLNSTEREYIDESFAVAAAKFLKDNKNFWPAGLVFLLMMAVSFNHGRRYYKA